MLDKSSKSIALYSKLLNIELVLITGIIFFTIIKMSSIVSLLFYGTFVVLIVGFVFEILLGYKADSFFYMAFLCMFSAFICTAIHSRGFSFVYYKKMIIFLCTILFLVVVVNAKIDRLSVETVLIINLIIASFYPILYILGYGTKRGEALVFNFTNPNLTGMYIIHSILYCILAFDYFKNKIIKTLCGGLIVLLAIFDYLTMARSSLIALAFFLILYFYNKYRKNKVKVTEIFSLCVILFPIVFAFIYLILYSFDLLSIFSFAEMGEGKGLNSRVRIWTAAFETIKENFFIGNYIVLWDDQLHNTHLDVLAAYGFITFIFFIITFVMAANTVLKNVKTPFSKNAMYAFYAIIIMGTFEASLVSGGVGLYILSFGFLILAKYNPEEQLLKEAMAENKMGLMYRRK